MDPAQRSTCDELLTHPYFDQFAEFYDRNDDQKARQKLTKREQKSRAGVSITLWWGREDLGGYIFQ